MLLASAVGIVVVDHASGTVSVSTYVSCNLRASTSRLATLRPTHSSTVGSAASTACTAERLVVSAQRRAMGARMRGVTHARHPPEYDFGLSRVERAATSSSIQRCLEPELFGWSRCADRRLPGAQAPRDTQRDVGERGSGGDEATRLDQDACLSSSVEFQSFVVVDNKAGRNVVFMRA